LRKLAPVTTGVLLTLTVALMIYFGGILAETVMLYPNIFRDPPASLELAREFMVAGSPQDFFPPFGFVIIVCLLAAVPLTWRTKDVRWWIVGAALVFLSAEFLFSAVFFWPRNTIMFVDPAGTHPPSYLRQVAAEFDAGHWVRVIGGGLAAGLTFAGAVRWHRKRVRETTAQIGGQAGSTPVEGS
jgi:uncharacterized membrane protein